MVTPNPLHRSIIIFATVFVGVSQPWGNTDVAIGPVEEASLMLITSEIPSSPWLLIKSANTMIVQQLNLPEDPVALLLAQCSSETIIRLECRQTTLNLHFPNGEKLLLFLLLATQPYKEWRRSVTLDSAAIREAWGAFTILTEWPQQMVFVQRPRPEDTQSVLTTAAVVSSSPHPGPTAGPEMLTTQSSPCGPSSLSASTGALCRGYILATPTKRTAARPAAPPSREHFPLLFSNVDSTMYDATASTTNSTQSALAAQYSPSVNNTTVTAFQPQQQYQQPFAPSVTRLYDPTATMYHHSHAPMLGNSGFAGSIFGVAGATHAEKSVQAFAYDAGTPPTLPATPSSTPIMIMPSTDTSKTSPFTEAVGNNDAPSDAMAIVKVRDDVLALPPVKMLGKRRAVEEGSEEPDDVYGKRARFST
ncbi:hypothetical protein BV22DRAFT_1133407 [Leucogyrophana mollusca]|uniref:Uncharacterized protein n=1 Tax=Leucogyrophana mollusca TaxID=85980 RepID=A0ACB8B390_9AGAM|nr:hypothetical protein BV22DRAFT_1133407 [Leucogyrophana mollusca]